MHAYAKTYLLEAMENLGEAADFAANDLELPLSKFWRVFAKSDWAYGFEHGMPWAVVGHSGMELVLRVCEEAQIEIDRSKVLTTAEQASLGMTELPGLSPEYWVGYSMAFLQWITCFTFSQIENLLPITTVASMYPTYHEQSEVRFAEAAMEIIRRNNPVCALKHQREVLGLSQSQLAKESGVGIRAIQQYEQGAKSIRRASYDTVDKLSRALFCKPQDLMYEPAYFVYELVSI